MEKGIPQARLPHSLPMNVIAENRGCVEILAGRLKYGRRQSLKDPDPKPFRDLKVGNSTLNVS